MSAAEWISRLLGWTYTIAWSLSFYPQVLLNYRRKSSTGLSTDFVAINPAGHASLLVVNLSLYASSIARRQYQSRHDGHLPQVRLNDVWFSIHATLLATFVLAQSFYYKREPSQRTSTYNRVFLGLFCTTLAVLALFATLPAFPGTEYLDLLNFLSFIKLYISFSKYVPQVSLNYKRKSTVGWSIENIILDLIGGTLSLAQLVLDSWIAADWQGIVGNPAKLGLALLTLGFDLIFIMQHFVLYRHSTTTILDPSSPPSEQPSLASARSTVNDVERSDSTVDRVDERDRRGGLTGGERQPLLDATR